MYIKKIEDINVNNDNKISYALFKDAKYDGMVRIVITRRQLSFGGITIP